MPTATVTKLRPRIVELVRVSSEGQVDKNTPELQRRALDELRKRRPGILVERIEALGVSGALGVEARVDLRTLAKLSSSKAYDELRVWNLDRLTRSDDPRERMAIYGMALDAGAVIVECNGSVIDPGEVGGMSEINFYLQTLFSATERRKILARTAAGRLRKAQDGLLVLGNPPYGRRFNQEAQIWELVPAQVVIYRRIIRELLEGRSTRAIAKGLNRDGFLPVKKPRDGHQPRWQHSTIMRLLKARSIIGEYKVCEHIVQIPPIATPEEWGRVLVALHSNASRSGPKPVRSAMLRKKLTCGACGKTVVVLSDGVGSVHRYACPKAHERAAPCPARRTIRAPDADAAVRAALLNVAVNSDALLQAIKLQNNSAPKADTSKELEQAEKELKKLDERMARTVRLMNEDLLPEAAGREQLVTIKELRAEAETRVQRAGAAPRFVSKMPTTKELVSAARVLGCALKAATTERMAELLRILVPLEEPFTIRLTPEGIEMVAHLPIGIRSGDLDQGSTHCGRRPQRPRART